MLCKAIMVRSKLCNIYLKSKTIDSREAYKKQRNYCVSLLRKTNLDVNLIKLWKNVKPFFSDKNMSTSNITLIEDNEVISDNTKCAEVMNNFFNDAVLNLDIDRDLHTENIPYINEPVAKAIQKYKNHPSILKLNEMH